MLYSNENRGDLENKNELGSLKNQLNASRLQVKMGKHNLHEDLKKVFAQVTDMVKDVSKI